ncbi:protein-export chaperone SecB [Sphingomonas sp. ST-64]|uniref:Protein-export protein SecB n=1 Tax=Sphingomonas plantiphila TaxID=3163295 RepID=A0ABW8YPC6_9SPHN
MDTPENAAPNGDPLANGADTAPSVGVISQYVKDFSFENPNSPAIYQIQGQPAFDVQFNIGAAEVAQDVHEVTLKIDVRAQMEDQVAFIVDLSYSGLFAIRNIPEEHLQPFLLGEAPRLLFPFARRVLADAVRDGGFPPLMLEPIDFNGLYEQQRMERDAQLQAGGEAGQA